MLFHATKAISWLGLIHVRQGTIWQPNLFSHEHKKLFWNRQFLGPTTYATEIGQTPSLLNMEESHISLSVYTNFHGFTYSTSVVMFSKLRRHVYDDWFAPKLSDMASGCSSDSTSLIHRLLYMPKSGEEPGYKAMI